MFDIEEVRSTWTPYYNHPKQYNKHKCNLLYTPLIDPSGTIMCQLFDSDSKYQHDQPRPGYTADFVERLWHRDSMYRDIVKNEAWCPNYLEVDETNQAVFLEWNGPCLAQHLLDGTDLDTVRHDWKSQLFDILLGFKRLGFVKYSLHPSSYFVDSKGILKTYNYFLCFNTDESISIHDYLPVISNVRVEKFETVSADFSKQYSAEALNRIVYETFDAQWPGRVMSEYYEKIYSQNS